MKALQVTAPGTFAVTDVARLAPQADEVAITVRAVGICGTDIEIIDGTMAYYTSGQARYPIVIGHEWVGEIAAVGAGVRGFAPGDRVVGEVSIGCMVCDVCRSGAYHRCPRRTETGVMNRSGGMAEEVVLPAWAVHRISPSIDLRAAALVEPTAVALNAVRLAALGPNDSVVVIGDGPIGLLLLQVAKARGAENAILIGADDRRLALAATFHPLDVIDARSGDAVAGVRSHYPALASVVLEASGTAAGVETAMAVAAPGARIILQGLLGRMPERPLSFDDIVIGDLTIRGALGSPGVWPEAISLIESGRVDPARIVTHEVPLTAFSEALAAVRSRQAVKAVVRPDQT